jgi:hypothetical protein
MLPQAQYPSNVGHRVSRVIEQQKAFPQGKATIVHRM